MTQPADALPNARVWVLDDPRAGTAAQAIGIAERLGVPFRRIPMVWTWAAHVVGLAPGGSLRGLAAESAASLRVPPGAGPGPLLVISAGRRSAAVALWLKAQYGCRLVHCMSSGLVAQSAIDLLVMPEPDNPSAAANVLPVLGAPHRVSPLQLRQASMAWQERLGHLPRPRIALLLGGPRRGGEIRPTQAFELGRRVAHLADIAGGSVMATTSRRTGAAATEALAKGLSPCLHLLFRWGEPGDNPYLGFLARADCIVVTADSVSMISEACATTAPVYVALPELAGPRQIAFSRTLVAAGQARWFDRSLESWQRQPLDESGRIAREVLHRFDIIGPSGD